MSSELASQIIALVRSDRYLVGLHASERLDERGILEWQVIEAMGSARFLSERPTGSPHPAAAFEIMLPDGTRAKAVWALLERSRAAKLVTVHYLDEV